MYWVLLPIAIALIVANWRALDDRPCGLFQLQFSFRPGRFKDLMTALEGAGPGPAVPAWWPCAALHRRRGRKARAPRPSWLVRHRRWLRWDYLSLICYGAFGWFFAGAHVTSALFPGWAVLVAPWLLPAAAAADALENTLHLHLTGARASPAPDWLYALSGLAASLKVLLILAFVGVVTLGRSS